jgi:hypothetical protein
LRNFSACSSGQSIIADDVSHIGDDCGLLLRC